MNISQNRFKILLRIWIVVTKLQHKAYRFSSKTLFFIIHDQFAHASSLHSNVAHLLSRVPHRFSLSVFFFRTSWARRGRVFLPANYLFTMFAQVIITHSSGETLTSHKHTTFFVRSAGRHTTTHYHSPHVLAPSSHLQRGSGRGVGWASWKPHTFVFFAINTTQFLATEFCYRMGMGQVSSVEGTNRTLKIW